MLGDIFVSCKPQQFQRSVVPLTLSFFPKEHRVWQLQSMTRSSRVAHVVVEAKLVGNLSTAFGGRGGGGMREVLPPFCKIPGSIDGASLFCFRHASLAVSIPGRFKRYLRTSIHITSTFRGF